MATVPNLTADASPTTDDLLYVINAPGGTPADRKVTIGNLLAAWSASAAAFASLTLTSSVSTTALVTTNSASSATAYSSKVTGDTQPRLLITAGGTLKWGPGGATVDDTNLYRNAANVLRTDDDFQVGGSITATTKVIGTAANGYLDLFGDSSATLGLRLYDTGSLVLGTGALATTATAGFLYIPTCAGAPTGVPTSYTGRAPIIFDTTNNKLWAYDGSWIGVVLA